MGLTRSFGLSLGECVRAWIAVPNMLGFIHTIYTSGATSRVLSELGGKLMEI